MSSTSTSGTQEQDNQAEADRLEANKAVARRYFDGVGGQNLDELSEFIAEDAVDETRAGDGPGSIEDFREHARWLWANVGEAKAIVTDLIAEGDRVVAFWRLEGVHIGEVFGVPATGRHFSGISISTLTIRGGKVVRYSVLPDRLGFVRQLSDNPS
jgi:predicted ester cyclase